MNDYARPVYLSSKGPMAIDSMPYPYLKNALAKAERESGQTFEVRAAMAARLAELDALPDDAARIAATTPTVSPPTPKDHNKPPELIGFDEIKAWIEDLYGEAKNWLDGAPILNQAQADEVSRLKRMLQEAERAADAERVKEAKPFDDGKAEVQARYAPLIADTKSVKGLTVRAVAACDAALTPWLRKLDDEHQEQLRRAEAEAEKAIETVKVITGAADLTRLDDAEVVEEAVQGAKAAIREVNTLSKERARVGGGTFRSSILKDNWTATLTDGDAALAHYWKMRRGDVEAFLAELAAKDVKATNGRPIPGFVVENQKRAV